jgi:hypothetical protein
LDGVLIYEFYELHYACKKGLKIKISKNFLLPSIEIDLSQKVEVPNMISEPYKGFMF